MFAHRFFFLLLQYLPDENKENVFLSSLCNQAALKIGVFSVYSIFFIKMKLVHCEFDP